MNFCHIAALCVVACLFRCAAAGNFTIQDNRFFIDGQPFRIVSGSIHYQRIHPAYWEDRLLRVKSLGTNTIQTYIPWNVHEPRPGHYNFEGLGDVFSFLELVHQLDLKVLLRPGPYICGEFEFGGLPWWLQAANQVKGGGTMRLRSSDPLWLAQVDAWWSLLLPRLKRFMHVNGGPVLMVQVKGMAAHIDNEFGFCGRPDPVYLRHLATMIRTHLGNNVQIYTTDPPYAAPVGTLPGQEVFTVVDFGPGVSTSYWGLKTDNHDHPSTGWITHWGEPMANTSAAIMVKTLEQILSYGNDTGSVNLYMGYGGSNFGYWAGANLAGRIYQPTITSYDYDCPVSEAGAYGQPGIGGPNKFKLIRQVFAKHTGKVPPAPVLPIPAQAHGQLTFTEGVALLDALPQLSQPSQGVHSQKPDIMEQYAQAAGFILYRTSVPAAAFGNEGAQLDLGAPVHDYAAVFLDGQEVGALERNNPRNLTLPALQYAPDADSAQLDILVHALGRVNFGCVLDMKGLQSPDVLLNGQTLESWTVYPLPLDPYPLNLTFAPLQQPAAKRHSAAAWLPNSSNAPSAGPAFFRGVLDINQTVRGPYGHMLDTYVEYKGWHKGLVFVNGFNLGWYWPSKGPQNTQYIPGPLLHYGKNEIVFLEVAPAIVKKPTVNFVATPDFFGPEETTLQKLEAEVLRAAAKVATDGFSLLVRSAHNVMGHIFGSKM